MMSVVSGRAMISPMNPSKAPHTDSDNSRSLSNGSELRVGDAQKYKSFRRFLNATFWLFAKDLGLGDIDYMIAGEPQENKIEL